MVSNSDQPDLGELLAGLVRDVIRHEEPILDRHDLQMWDYAILSGLRQGATATQAELAARVGRDKTRLIGNLDGLESRGLVTRAPDPADRRNRIVSLTPAGAKLVATCRADIKRMEDDLLEPLPASDRRTFFKALRTLTESR